MTCREIIIELKSHRNPRNIAGMARFGISAKGTLGIAIPYLRKLAKEIGKDNGLAQELWKSKIHEARLLAGFIAEPEKASEQQIESWVKDFDSWDICDQVCSNFFDKTKFCREKIGEWTKRKEEFVKRAGFVLMACLAVHDKKAKDSEFLKYLPLIRREAKDERNFVKKAVNWALRQIGKRNLSLRRFAIKTAKEILRINSKSAKWIASNALAELNKR